MDKSVVLIDAENILKSWINYCSNTSVKEKIDYVKLIDEVSKNTNLLRAFL